MKYALVIATLAIAIAPTIDADAQWRRALPGYTYEFPRDHFAHPNFKTEWWYFTGNVESALTGDRYGFQFTIFRQGIRPPGERIPATSRFVIDHFHFAHLAVSDITHQNYTSEQRTTRGAFGEADATAPTVARVEDWQIDLNEDGSFRVAAGPLDLVLRSTKPPVINGIDGASQKAAGIGNASHYYSLTRLATAGTIRGDPVAGTAWFDREWGTSQLGPEQVGWDWFALQLDDGTELMIYQLREQDGTASPYSSGTYTDSSGAAVHLTPDQFSLQPRASWRSESNGAVYPLEWLIAVPSLGLALRTDPAFEAQEFTHPPVAYWEGAVRVTGSHRGVGYTELTGYAGALPGLSTPPSE